MNTRRPIHGRPPRRAAGTARALLLALLAGSAAACGSSPRATFYALSPRGGSSQPGSTNTVKIRRPAIAGYLDRPEIVRRVADFTLGMIDTDRWGEPLDAMIARVLAQDLQERVPGSTVFTEDGAISADARATVELDVRRFDVGDDGAVTLLADVAIEHDGDRSPATLRAFSLRAEPASGTTRALVAAMSDALAQLADRIAGLLQT